MALFDCIDSRLELGYHVLFFRFDLLKLQGQTCFLVCELLLEFLAFRVPGGLHALHLLGMLLFLHIQLALQCRDLGLIQLTLIIQLVLLLVPALLQLSLYLHELIVELPLRILFLSGDLLFEVLLLLLHLSLQLLHLLVIFRLQFLHLFLVLLFLFGENSLGLFCLGLHLQVLRLESLAVRLLHGTFFFGEFVDLCL